MKQSGVFALATVLAVAVVAAVAVVGSSRTRFGCARTSDDVPATSDTPPVVFRKLAVSGEVMGTFWNATAYVSDQDRKWDEETLATTVQKSLDAIDRAMSTYKPDSEISRFNAQRNTEWFELGPDTAAVVELALKVSATSEGAFDITVGPLVNLWRFGPNKTPLVAIPDDETVARTREQVGWSKLEFRRLPTPAVRKTVPDLYVDLSAIAKGYAVDRAVEALENAGLDRFLLDVGGEVACRGMKPQGGGQSWVLGIETPLVSRTGPSVPRRTVLLDNLSLATSGDYRNYRRVGDVRFSHLIDPRSGRPVETIREGEKEPSIRLGSVSVVTRSCAEADAWATAMFVLGPEKGVELADRLNLPVLFVSRESVPGRPTRFHEAMSKAFRDHVSSTPLQ